MRLTSDDARANQVFPRRLAALLFLCVTSGGCDHNCVSFFSDPGGGTLSLNTSTCSRNTKTNGMVRLRWSASPALGAAPGTTGVQHILVSLRGLEAHLRPVGDEGPSDWIELAPSLVRRPVEIDLLATNDDSFNSILASEAPVPTAEYTELRMLLVSDRPLAGEPVPEKSRCVAVGFNCAITADGGVHALILRGGGSEIPVPATGVTSGMFYVLGDTTTNLNLELSRGSSVAFAPGRAVWLNPVFDVHSEFSPDSREEPEPPLPINH